MIMRVRVSFTMVANWPAASENAKPAATTDDVSLMAVPAHIPNPASLMPSRCPRLGNVKTARMLKRKIVEMEELICLTVRVNDRRRRRDSRASADGCAHADENLGVPIHPSARPTRAAVRKAAAKVNTITRSD